MGWGSNFSADDLASLIDVRLSTQRVDCLPTATREAVFRRMQTERREREAADAARTGCRMRANASQARADAMSS